MPSELLNASQLNKVVLELEMSLDGEVRFGEASRALYATDASHYRQIPIGVVIPKTIQDVIRTVELCRRYDLPILSRGGGTSVAGQCCNEAVVLDFSKYLNTILYLDPKEKTARVQPGVVLDDLRHEAEKYGLTFGPDPSTHSRCTLGGMIGNDACGVHSLLAGRTVHNILSLKILTYDGSILEITKGESQKGLKRIYAGEAATVDHKMNLLWDLKEKYDQSIRKTFPKIPRRVSGYGLDQLLTENDFNLAGALVGTEGTCVLILEATVQLIEMPRQSSLVVIGYPDICKAADCVPSILEHKPIGLEGFDELMIRNIERKGFHQETIQRLPKGRAWMIAEFGGRTLDEIREQTQKVAKTLQASEEASFEILEKARDIKAFWALREFGPGAAVFVPGKADTWSGWEDAAVSPEKLGDYLREFLKLLEHYSYEGCIYGHFGDGCVHTRISFDFKSEEGIKKYRRFIYDAADLVGRYKGSFSGEHGDGHARGELLELMYGAEIVTAFKEFKSIWDPRGRMNPGKVVDAYRLDEHLRLHPHQKDRKEVTHFSFQDDGGSFYQAVSRCVGIGKCRQKDSGVMCPSYRATLEEKHSTRGRAHLLQEMLEGELLQDGWQNEEVKEALDLCLSCKGCKSECPTNVDIGSYKAEFLSHYYEKRKRPISAHIFGHIDRWAHLASKAPAFSNSILQNPLFNRRIKKWLRVAQERSLPPLAPETFRHWFRQRGARNRRRPEVALWPDTFHNYFHPEPLKSATRALEILGFRVRIPRKPICCGRPLYDYGMLEPAKRSLRGVLKSMSSSIRRGVPLVGLEPSCLSVFRDEMCQILPRNEMARIFSKQVFTFAEFITGNVKNIMYYKLRKKAMTQGHCHQQSVLGGMDAEEQLMRQIGLEAETLDAGCCGMAGAFGYEEDHYEVSKDIAERVLLPRMREADDETLLIANGFSCREQIRQLTGREPLHIAQAVEKALTVD